MGSDFSMSESGISTFPNWNINLPKMDWAKITKQGEQIVADAKKIQGQWRKDKSKFPVKPSDCGSRAVPCQDCNREICSSNGSCKWSVRRNKCVPTDVDILSMGKKMSATKYKGGTKFKYCFDDYKKCDEKFALQRCIKIRNDNDCVKRTRTRSTTGCKFRERDGKCCLRYKCDHKTDKIEEELNEDTEDIGMDEKDFQDDDDDDCDVYR